MAAAGFSGDLAVAFGPRLLAGVAGGPSLSAHRQTWAAPEPISGEQLIALTEATGLRGRGGAAFPFGRKVAAALAAGRRRSVVVNAAEGEPGSGKDSALLVTVPHLVLDGAELAASALRTNEIRVVVPAERPAVGEAVRTAVGERSVGVTFEVIETDGGFVGGQARAVIELVEGRENLPVTAWAPEAVSGIKGRPTLLSNAETYAQVATLVALGAPEYTRVGTPEEPGTTLLTVAGDGPGGVVLEVPFGIPLAEVLGFCGYPPDGPVLVGGYHGTWLPAADVNERLILRADLQRGGGSLGAGVILPLDPASCPVTVTARIVEYLAAHSARRCGPCKNGLPALAQALARLAQGGDVATPDRIRDLAGLVTGRGACAHPDGTARLVRSMFAAFGDEVTAHTLRRCSVGAPATVDTGRRDRQAIS
jgi:NADH:ubiquinone oxidoreductase subunit F (NADH-binding)